jgi:hypothetical protein
MVFQDVLLLDQGKNLLSKIWDISLLIRRSFTSDEDIQIPANMTLVLHSPAIDGELVLDGEGFIE